MSDEDLSEVLAAIGGDDPSPDFVSSLRTQLDAELTNDHRSPGDVQDVTLVEAPLYQEQQQMNKKRWIGGLAAAAAVVVIVGAIVIANDDDDDGTVVGASRGPLTVIDDYFATYNDGDTDAVLAIAAPDVIVTVTYGVVEPQEDWDQLLAWNNAQGEILTEHTCILTDDQPVVGAAFSCEFDTLDAVILAVDGIPIPTQTLFTVSDGAITKINHDYESPTDFGTAGGPFNLWMEQNHPDVEGAGFGQWTSRAEAVEYGQLRAHWAQEWAIYREANDCTTPPGRGSHCPPE
jgi:hypothetical protein